MEINDIIPNEANYYITLLLNNKLTRQYDKNILNFLDGTGKISTSNNIENNIFTFDELLKYKKLLLFKLLETVYDPLSIYYPFSIKTAKKIEKLEINSFNSVKDDPLKMYDNFENSRELQTILNKDPIKKTEYDKTKNTLFNVYMKLVNNIIKKLW